MDNNVLTSDSSGLEITIKVDAEIMEIITRTGDKFCYPESVEILNVKPTLEETQ